MDAFIPATYISDEMQKLDIYKRIAGIENEEEKAEMLDELIDRFGEPVKSVENLLEIALLRAAAHKAYITEIKQKGGLVTLSILPDAKIDPACIPEMVKKHAPYLEFQAAKDAPAFLLHTTRDNRFPKKELIAYLKDLTAEIVLLQ
jgi:transcription-repair coupling factor (superfamily II helicase)